jgi:hypothetical protein
MNLLAETRCTVIGHMQYANGRDIRENINTQLEKMNIKLFDHYKQPFIMDVNEDEETHDELRLALKNEEYDKVEAYKEIRSYDLSLIDRSDFVIFVYDPEVVTCGSWEEFFTANRMKKPIFFVNVRGKNKTPMWVFWTIPHKYIYDSVESVIEKLQKIDQGKLPIDSERWKLLNKHFR